MPDMYPWKWLSVVLVVILPVVCQAALAPYATYEQVFQYSNGAISVNQTAQFVLSDAESGGLLQVGEHTVLIQSLPPKLRYRSKEVARIPKSVTLQVEEVCLTAGDGHPPIEEDTATVETVSRRLLALLTENSRYEVALQDEVEYSQFQYITQKCSLHSLDSAQRGLFNYFYGLERFPNDKSPQTYIRELWASLKADSSTQISQSVYMRKIPELLYDRYNDRFGWAYFALNVIRGAWVKRSLSILEDDLLRTCECQQFPGYCFTSESDITNQQVSTCRQYENRAITLTLQYEKSSSYNVVKGLTDALSTKFEKDYEALKNSANAQIAVNEANSQWAAQVGLAFKSLNATTAAQNAINAQTALLFSQQSALNQRFLDNDGFIRDALNDMYETSDSTTAMLISALEAEAERVNSLNGGLNNATNFKFSLIIDAMKNMTSAGDVKMQELYRGIQDLSELLQFTAGQLSSFIQQKQFNRLVTQSYYRSRDKLLQSGSEEQPLVSGAGIPPTPLKGVQLKALVDTIVIVSHPAVIRMDFFADSHLMLNSSRPWTTIEQIVRWMGVAPCVIRANLTLNNETDWTSPQHANITNYCVMWVESTVIDCVGEYDVASGSCSSSSMRNDTLTTSTALFSFLDLHCTSNLNSTITSISLFSSLEVLHQNSTCESTFQERMITVDREHDPLIITLTFVWTAYMQTFQATLRALELLTYGQMPKGVHTEILPLGYTPTPTAGVDGGRITFQCMRGYWLSVHPDTLPVTSLTFVSDSTKNQDVVVSIAVSPACASNGNLSATCYSVRDEDLRVNWVFRDSVGITLPGQIIVIGDVTSPSFSSVYDAPSSLVLTTPNPLVRESLLTYLMMPVGTEKTSEFSFFDATSVGLFNAKAGSASATDYQFPAIFDQEGFPLCNIDGGLPVSATFTPPVNKCVLPFVWSGIVNTTLDANFSALDGPVINPQHSTCLLQPVNSSLSNTTVLLKGRNSVEFATTLPGRVINFWTAGVEMTFTFWVYRIGTSWLTGSTAVSAVQTLWSGTLILDQVSYALTIQSGRRVNSNTANSIGHVVLLINNIVRGQATTFPITADRSEPYIEERWMFMSFTINSASVLGFFDGELVKTFPSLKVALGRLMATGSLIEGSNDNQAEVLMMRSMKFYAWALNEAQIKSDMACSQVVLFPRCWIPQSTANASLESSTLQDSSIPVLALQDMRPSCLARTSGMLLFSSFPAYTSPSWDHENFLDFTVTFWLKRRIDSGTLLFTDGHGMNITHSVTDGSDPNYGQSQIRMSFDVDGVCAEYLWSINAMFGSSPLLGPFSMNTDDNTLPMDLNYTQYAIVVSGELATLFVNATSRGIVDRGNCSIDSSVYVASNSSAGCRGKKTSPCTNVQMVYAYSSALSAVEIKNQVRCETSSYSMGTETTDFVFPRAICTLDPSDAGLGYCRHFMMCDGHCAAFARVDSTKHTFYPLQIICDPGWLAPDCVERCLQTTASGECLVQTQIPSTSIVDLVADAFSPNGYWCLALKFFQAGAVSVNGQSYVDFAYRQYEYLTDLTIPSGDIITVVPAGTCPTVTLQENGDGSLWVILTNVFSNFTQLNIITRSQGVCTSPSVCCDDVYPLVIPPYTTKNWDVPTLCSSLEITIELDFGNEQFLCQAWNSTTVSSQRTSSRTAPVSANIARTVVITGNDVLNNMLAVQNQITHFQVNFQVLAYRALVGGIDIRRSLDDAAVQIASVPPPTSLDSPILVNPWDSSKLPAILANLSAAINASAALIGQQEDALVNLVTLNARMTTLTAEVDSAIGQQQVALDVFQAQVNESNIIIQDSIAQLAANLAAYQEAIAGLVAQEAEARTKQIQDDSLSTVAIVFLAMGSVLGALSMGVILWPYAARYYEQYQDWFNSSWGRGRMRRVRQQSDIPVTDERGFAVSPSEVEFTLPGQANVTASAISRANNRMAHPHLYS